MAQWEKKGNDQIVTINNLRTVDKHDSIQERRMC